MENLDEQQVSNVWSSICMIRSWYCFDVMTTKRHDHSHALWCNGWTLQKKLLIWLYDIVYGVKRFYKINTLKWNAICFHDLRTIFFSPILLSGKLKLQVAASSRPVATPARDAPMLEKDIGLGVVCFVFKIQNHDKLPFLLSPIFIILWYVCLTL